MNSPRRRLGSPPTRGGVRVGDPLHDWQPQPDAASVAVTRLPVQAGHVRSLLRRHAPVSRTKIRTSEALSGRAVLEMCPSFGVDVIAFPTRFESNCWMRWVPRTGGLGSVAFLTLLLGLPRRFALLSCTTARWQRVVGGLTVGLLAYFVPAVLGVCSDQVDRVLRGDLVLRTVVLLAFFKGIATAVCYASGNAGGVSDPNTLIMAKVMPVPSADEA